MPGPRTRTLFLSSTGLDLANHRIAAQKAINALDGWKCVWMEAFGARDWNVDAFCREKVAECDLFIGIIGHRFGACPPDSKESYTQREYFAARDAEKPRLLFLAPDDFPVPAKPREPEWKLDAQAAFRESLQASGDRMPGSVSTNKDKFALQITQAIHHWELNPRTPADDPARYLEALHRDTSHIGIGGFQVGQKETYRFPIAELYTPLTTVLLPDEERTAKERKPKKSVEQPREQRAAPLKDALWRDRIVIVGDPGSGKTTFLRRIAFALCETLLGRNLDAAGEFLNLPECPFPILLSAGSLAEFIGKNKGLAASPGPDAPEWLLLYLESITRERGWGLSRSFFESKLGGTACLLMLDGLDEAPDEKARKSLIRMLELAGSRFRGARFVLTSRPPGYGGEAVIPDFATVQLAPLDDQAIATFLGNWCRLLYKKSEETAASHLRELQEAIGSRDEIRLMAVNPVMLTALAVVHSNEKRLPDQRADLYEAVLRWLARTSEDKKGGMPAERSLALLAHLAWSMHAAGRKFEITSYAAARAIAPRFREIADEDERIAAAKRFILEEELHSGIVVRRGDKLKYWHPTFQEYLAARAIAGLKDKDRHDVLLGQGKLWSPDWRETVLLLGGVLHEQGVDRVDALVEEVLDALPPNANLRERARCAGVIGAMLRDLRAVKYRIADPRWRRNLDLVAQAVFTAEGARQAEFPTRLDAAEAIGLEGDPRLKGENWVRLEGGVFNMGADKKTDPEAYDDESPVHKVRVSPFELGKYPVTVEEYGRFLGKSEHTEPTDWRDQLRHPNRPVVRVSWHDAAAYCQWASCRLPTEAEWEFAARNGKEGWKYPWGNEKPDPDRANYAEGGPGHPTPVGLYPAGSAAPGAVDMAGNVWEWVADWYDKYRGGPVVTNPKGPGSGASKVLRGGSWLNNPRVLRSSYRYGYGPDNRNHDIGFRCARDISL